jgi:FkbH-like protein
MERDLLRKGLLVSDFNVDNLSAYLKNDVSDPRVDALTIPYGQIGQTLVDGSQPCWQSDLDFVVIWTRPEAVLGMFGNLLAFSDVDMKCLYEQVDEYAARLLAIKDRAKVFFVPTWVVQTFHQGRGMLDLAPRVGISRALLQVNLRLLENLDRGSNIVPLNASTWIEAAGEKAFNSRLWYMAKVPFANEVFKAAAKDIKAALRGIGGKSRKLMIVDLDDTLWGGIVGDQGWESITLGGHDPVGEALVDFQRELKALTRRGVVLAIVSKNDESVALEAIRRHPEMVLRADDFAAWRINWHDKAANIVDVVEELSLGLDSVVFIDDSPVERARVRDALPDVLVPEWPADRRLYPDALRSLDCFDKPTISDEDRHRSGMYVTERRRAELKQEAGTLEEWLRNLSIVVTVESLTAANLARVVQLMNKTNQFNLSTRRVTGPELLAWASRDGHQLWVCRVGDKFGDSGLTGIVSVERQNGRARIEDFVLSCRVMGRKVEETMLHIAVQWAREAGLEELYAVYKPTPKNKPCVEFLRRSGLQARAEHVFAWPLQQEYPVCPEIRLIDQTGGVESMSTAGSRTQTGGHE